jgi:hypothetical protein
MAGRLVPVLALCLGLSACAGETRVIRKASPDHGPAQVDLPVTTDQIEQCWDRFHRGAARLDLSLGDEPWRDPWNVLLVDRAGDFRQVALGPHDAYLFDGGGYLGRSSDYFDSGGRGLPFEAEFTVRVQPLRASSTRVLVESHLYRIRVGSRMVITHSGREAITKEVTPSRWDEYRVILCVAACLGVEKPLAKALTPPHIDRKSDWLKSCRSFEYPTPRK